MRHRTHHSVPMCAVVLLAMVMGLAWNSRPARAEANLAPDSARVETRLIVLPFRNLSGDPQARDWAMKEVYSHLNALGFSPFSPDSVEQILRRHRIRETGQVRWEDAQRLCEAAGSRWILLGSVDAFAPDDPIQTGFSARLVDAVSGEIVCADACYATGKDHLGLLGLGEVKDIYKLAHEELAQLFLSLQTQWKQLTPNGASPGGAGDTSARLFILPFENISTVSEAPFWIAHSLLGVLLHRGFRVIEPGMVQEQLLANDVIQPGQADVRTIKELAEHFAADYCLTGMVSSLGEVQRLEADILPVVRVEARLLNAAQGTIIWADAIERTGGQSAVIFGLGSIRSPGKLVQNCLDELVGRLIKETRQKSS